MLAKVSHLLPEKLLLLLYSAVIRSHLEYASAVRVPAAKTHLDKLEAIQRISARIICHAPRDAHAGPLLDKLDLETLQVRRELHVKQLVGNIINHDSHPYFENMFSI